MSYQLVKCFQFKPQRPLQRFNIEVKENLIFSQQTNRCSKSIIEALENSVKYVQS